MRALFLPLISVLLLLGCEEQPTVSKHSAIPTSDPVAKRDREFRGYKYERDTMAGAKGGFHWAQQALSNYSRLGKKDYPASIGYLPASSCQIPRATGADHVQVVHVAVGMQESPVYGFNREDVGERAEDYVKYVMNKGKAPSRLLKFSGNDHMSVVNVVVTKTPKPTYLVLVSQTNVIWNIQSAPDAKFSRIVVVSRDGAGVANAPTGVPFSTLVGHRHLKKCKVSPSRQPREEWGFIRNLGGLKSRDKTVTKNINNGAAFARWLNSRFGGGAGRNVIDPYGVSNVLVGPMPRTAAARIPFKPLSGAPLLVARQDYVFAASRKEYFQKNRKLVVEAATKAAGGDLSLLMKGK